MINKIDNNKNSKVLLNKEIKEIKSINQELLYSLSSLKDLTHLNTYTIDDKDTIEIDDAISLERVNDKNKLWVHIASPAVHIEYDSAIDKYAKKLISTLYLSEKNIYMLPKVLIEEIFSLNNREVTASLSLGFIFNNDGSIVC